MPGGVADMLLFGVRPVGLTDFDASTVEKMGAG